MVKIVLRENGNFETKTVFKWFRCRRACFFRKQNKTDFQLITVWNCFFLFWQKYYYYVFINLNINCFEIRNDRHFWRSKLSLKGTRHFDTSLYNKGKKAWFRHKKWCLFAKWRFLAKWCVEVLQVWQRDAFSIKKCIQGLN